MLQSIAATEHNYPTNALVRLCTNYIPAGTIITHYNMRHREGLTELGAAYDRAADGPCCAPDQLRVVAISLAEHKRINTTLEKQLALAFPSLDRLRHKYRGCAAIRVA